jgi:hypothetical protein
MGHCIDMQGTPQSDSRLQNLSISLMSNSNIRVTKATRTTCITKRILTAWKYKPMPPIISCSCAVATTTAVLALRVQCPCRKWISTKQIVSRRYLRLQDVTNLMYRLLEITSKALLCKPRIKRDCASVMDRDLNRHTRIVERSGRWFSRRWLATRGRRKRGDRFLVPLPLHPCTTVCISRMTVMQRRI